MNITKRMWLIRIIALIGLGLSIELAIIYFRANFDESALYSFCSINSYIDCDGVAKSSYSQFAGIPLAWWGIFFYLFVLFMSFVDKINSKIKTPLIVFKNPIKYISVLGLISFCISMTLASVVPIASAISAGVGSLPNFCNNARDILMSLFMVSTI